jgi:hypothetical protein
VFQFLYGLGEHIKIFFRELTLPLKNRAQKILSLVGDFLAWLRPTIPQIPFSEWKLRRSGSARACARSGSAGSAVLKTLRMAIRCSSDSA